MFTTLPESRTIPSRSPGATIASLLVHATLLTAAVTLTLAGSAGANVAPAVVLRDSLVWIPLERPEPTSSSRGRKAATGSRPQPPRIPRISLLPRDPEPGTSLPVPDSWWPGVAIADSTTGGTSELPAGRIHAGLGSAGGVVGEHEVDRSPQVRGSVQPRYPDALRAAGITGTVVAEFVVDTAGQAEPGSLRVLQATRAEFGDAVRAALPGFRFAPGELSGRKVRTRVQMPFAFLLR